MRRRAPNSLVCALCLLCVSCAAPAPVEEIQPGQTPNLDSVEAGLWMQMERTEEGLRTSGRVVDDPELNAYVRGIVCRLGPDYCDDIRVYIVRAAGFNASMAPNGLLSVWTGLILRAENEAQLAFVLGHELIHYRNRHSLQMWRNLRAKTDAMVVFQVATAMVGVGILGDLAQLATLGSVMAFSRDHEREADRGGLELLAKAGYDTREAPRVWTRLIEEKEAGDEPDRLVFFSTHPASEERQKTLSELSEQMDGTGQETGHKRFLDVTADWRGDWLRDELRQRDFDRMEVILNHMTDTGVNLGELHFYRGEIHRLRGGDEDRSKAVTAYEEALRTGHAPVETHRSLGLVYWSMDQPAQAGAAFEQYLAARPDADDRQMIEHYLTQIRRAAR